MKITDLFEDDEEEGRLETRTIDDEDGGEEDMGGEDFGDIEGAEGEDGEFADGDLDGMDAGGDFGGGFGGGGAMGGGAGGGMGDDGPSFDDVGEPDRVVDSKLWSKVASDDYVSDYDHSGNESVHPRFIASLSKDELTKLQSRIDDLISKIEMNTGGVGLYKNETYGYLVALKAFTERVKKEKGSD